MSKGATLRKCEGAAHHGCHMGATYTLVDLSALELFTVA